MSRRDGALPASFVDASGSTRRGSRAGSRASSVLPASSSRTSSIAATRERDGSSLPETLDAQSQSILHPHPHSHLSTLLPFQRQILQSLIPPPDAPLDEGDALTILARGLGLRTIISALLRCYDSQDALILLVNAGEEESAGIAAELDLMGARKPGLRRIVHDSNVSSRQELYAAGGLLSITSRILIVDMLNHKIPISKVAGIVVMHAEEITPLCTESFIARMYREENKDGFLKAFSDDADRFAIGLSPLQTVLGQLRIREVRVWPRFHKSVIRDLGSGRGDVIQLHQPLSRSMRAIQTAIVECLDATLGELKRGAGNVDIEDCTVENALFRSFDAIVRRQLDPVWHRVGAKTRQLVGDLSTLRGLLRFLLAYDAVRFNQYLETILAHQPRTGLPSEYASGGPSPWLFMDAANTILGEAKRRVYVGEVSASAELNIDAGEEEADEVDEEAEAFAAAHQASLNEEFAEAEAALRGGSAAKGQSTRKKKDRLWWMPPGLEAVLEENPKWHLLREVLDEIEQEVHWSTVDLTQKQKNTILVMVDSDQTCGQLREYLAKMKPLRHGPSGLEDADDPNPGRKMMERRLKHHLFWKGNMGSAASNVPGNAAANPSADGRSATNGHAYGASEHDGRSAALKRKDQAAEFDRHASALKRRRRRGGAVGGVPLTRVKGGAAERGADMDKESDSVATFMSQALARGREEAIMSGATEADIEMPSIVDLDADDDDVGDQDEEEGGAKGGLVNAIAPPSTQMLSQMEFENYFGILSPEELVVVRPYRGDADDNMLQELKPRFIVLYDPNPAFVRRLECYRASPIANAVRVYFLMYAESVEEQRYLSEMRREKESFERLIREKANMALPLLADGRPSTEVEQPLRTINSRMAGGQISVTNETPRIIVDMREFRSSLPSMLHAAGVEVKPCTLQVGDYVLSPEMCVERKSLSDLVQSFNSGRLYTQCEMMSIHYTHPILLIEFDERKSFSLQTVSEAKTHGRSTNVRTTKPHELDIQSKLVLLTSAFHRLRVVWSSSSHQTANIFLDLKASYDEPDMARVAAVGTDENSANNETALSAAGLAGGYNLTPQEILLSLPGITTKNVHYVMGAVRDLTELCDLNEEELTKLIGNEPGKTLHRFLTRNTLRKPSLLRPSAQGARNF
ncbi:hypothetical protein IE81DRAFT_325773 [Ceraceosorus guamensis]|uniref:ERCC4 domain-containing protein n=1 Tax=Ceraceosorus guamensis TaxID=1522189 RepID=A0A316VRW7_9BASI|nr:hypothetical protein IE81DRAFT_325773 [Ceraceosorus guamensis]PWN40252.1 hypothetical protein IE81DRAFT_325773 [Ceraceosorus guamensis]